MKMLFKLVLWLIVLLPFVLVGAIVWSIDDHAVVQRQFSLGPDEVKRARALVAEHDPRKAKEGEVRTISLNGKDLNLVGSYLLDLVGGAALVTVEPRWLDLRASVPVPGLRGRFVNLAVGLREAEVLPRFRYLEIGRIPVPNAVSDFLLQRSLDALYSRPGYESAADVVHKVVLADNRVEVTYQWQSALADSVRSTLISGADQDRLRLFQHRLAEVVNAGSERVLGLEAIVRPLFELAASRGAGGDAVADNRAAIVVLSAYVNGHDLARLAPEVRDWRPVRPRSVLAHGRDDLPKHYLTSAGLAVTGGSTLSQAIGLFKEVDDSRGGSGFSFTDLLADKAGTRLGEMAVASPRAATDLQLRLARPLRQSELIPDLAGLRDGLTEQQFKRDYGEIGSPAYREVVRVIDERIAASRLYD